MRLSRISPPPLSPECPNTLAGAVELVLASWAAHGAMSTLTCEKYGMMLGRFVKFAAANGVGTLHDVDKALVEAFVNALGRTRHGHVREPKAGTAGIRRSALRSFYSAVIDAGWATSDPTERIRTPRSSEALRTRPLIDDEAERVRFLAGTEPRGVRAVIVNLLLSGAGTGEVGGLIASDCEFDGDRARVRLPGSGGHKARVIQVVGCAARVLAARCAHLDENAPAYARLCGRSSNPVRAQAKNGMIVGRVLASADLHADPRVKPTSLTAWAARKAYETTGRIEDAARLLGASSLDITANLIDWDWNTEVNG